MARLFYVYEHWRSDRDECFYVGKGHSGRANDMRRRNPHHKFLQQKLARIGSCVEVRLVATELTEEQAFALERERIAFWRNDGADLVNLTDGGEGPSGRKQPDDEKARRGVSLKKHYAVPENMEAHRQRQSDPAFRDKQRAATLQKFQEEGERERQSERLKRYYETPGAKDKHSAAVKAAYSNPARVEAHSQGQKRRFENPEEREKYAARRRGTKLSDETRAKMRASHRARHARKKENL